MSNLSDYNISLLKPAWTRDNCILAAPIYIDIEINQQSGTDVGFSTLSAFLGAILPAPVNQSSAGDLCDWWAKSWVTNTNETSNFVTAIDACCHQQVCDIVDWPGDPDIAGIGMIVIYGTLLAIVDIYAIAYCMRHIPKLLGYPKSAWARHIRRIIKPPGYFERDYSQEQDESHEDNHPFEGTTQDLLDLCLAFAITSEISTLAFHSMAVTRYEMVIAELLCLFASSASATLWIFHSEIGRFKVTRFILFIISVVLPIPVIIIHATMREQIAKDFVMMCVDMELDYITTSRLRDSCMFTSWAVMFAFQIGISIIFLPCAIYKYVLELLPDNDATISRPSRSLATSSKASRFLQFCLQWFIQRCRRFRFLSRWYKSACAVQQSKLFKGICVIGSTWGFMVMIAGFVEILRMRSRMREAAGLAYNENAWGFGQIFALTTWFPLLPAWLAIAIKGSQNGFNSRLPEAWKAIKKSLARCNCAADSCHCRKHFQQSQTNEKDASEIQENIADADGDTIEEAHPQGNGLINGCCD